MSDDVDAILKTVTPDEMRGRLEGIGLAVVGTGPLVGERRGGVAGRRHERAVLRGLGGIACIVGAGLLALAPPRYYRTYDAAGPTA